ncbi:hypothetical protein ACWD33_05635 [Streptomyces xiamenensis]
MDRIDNSKVAGMATTHMTEQEREELSRKLAEVNKRSQTQGGRR